MKKTILMLIATTLCAVLMVGCINDTPTQKNDSSTSTEDNDKKDTPKEEPSKGDSTKDDSKNNPPKVEGDTSLNGAINAKIIYHENFSENNYYIVSTLKSKDKETLVKDIIEKLKTLPDESYFKALENAEFMPVPSDLKVNSVKIGNNVVTVDFNKDFSVGLGSAGENNLLQSIVNSIGVNLGVEKVIITFNGKNYSSGHIIKNTGEGFSVSKKAPRLLKK